MNFDARKLIREKYITPFKKKDTGYVGVELEFPLINLKKESVSVALLSSSSADSLMNRLISSPFDFKIADTGHDGLIAGVENSYGDLISFDNSFNNIEFSMGKALSVKEISARFYKYIQIIQDFLKENDHIITGMGTNPYKDFISDSPVNYDIYNCNRSFLNHIHTKMSTIKTTVPAANTAISSPSTSGLKRYHGYIFFPAYISSVQTHIDATMDTFLEKFNLHASLDFARAALFSNSLPFSSEHKAFPDCICFRDYLWESGGFSYNPLNAGKNNRDFSSVDDFIESYMTRSIHMNMRNGKYNHFMPVPLKDYFSGSHNNSEDITNSRPEDIDCGRPEDIDCFYSFRTVEATFRGTIEIRSDCAQPIREAFAPSAFNFGISASYTEAKNLFKSFIEEQNLSNYTNGELRDFIIYNNCLPGSSNKSLSAFLLKLIQLSDSGLNKISPQDIPFLEPLYERALKLKCPAKEMKTLLSKGMSYEKMIRIYAASL